MSALASTSSMSQQQAELFRSLTWDATVSLCICLAEDELPAGSDRSIDALHMQVPRISYLPLLIPEIRKNLLDLVLDDNESALLREDQLWLDCEGEPLRWHWPIGLTVDYLRANRMGLPPQAALRPAPRSYFPANTSSSPNSHALRLNIHLSKPPLDKLLLSSSIDASRSAFMNQVKEADVVRWGSVRRVTALRKVDQDALWDSVVTNDFERFWGVASRLVPMPPRGKPASRGGTTSPPVSASSTMDVNRLPEAGTMRSIPMRVYLPHGGPVMQDIIPPIVDGRPQTLQGALNKLVPLFFPPAPTDMSASFIAQRKQLVKRVLVQGIDMPLDAELAWCSTCLANPDGWLSIVLGF